MKGRESAACPAKDVFVRAFRDELPRAEQERLLAHVLTCPRCCLRFKTLTEVTRRLRSSEDLGEPAADRSRLVRVWTGPARIAAAILIVIGIGAAGLAFFSHRPVSSALRGQAGTVLRLLEPDESLTLPPFRFRWTPLSGADVYDFEIVGEDLTTVYQGGGRTASLKIPESVRRRLVRGAAYIWTVTAYNDNNQKLDSASKTFRIK